MNENDASFEENELTTEDLDILKAFDAIESWPADSTTTELANSISQTITYHRSDAEREQDELIEMLMIFLEEAGEDISKMRQACNQIAQNHQFVATRFGIFQRAGHKLRGTAAAVGYPIMSLAAEHIEAIAEQVLAEKVIAEVGFRAIESAVTVLEYCHQQLSENGQEPSSPDLLAELETHYNKLGIQIIHQNSPATAPLSVPLPVPEENSPREKTTQPIDLTTKPLPALKNIAEAAPSTAPAAQAVPGTNAAPAAQVVTSSTASFMHVEVRRFEKLLNHTEQLVELHASLENAQTEVRIALKEQQEAQTRLQQLEQALSDLLLEKNSSKVQPDQISSSLIARILSSSEQTPAHARKSKKRPKPQAKKQEAWDELDLEHYSEKDLLLRALREALVHQSICTTRVNAVSATLQKLQQEYMARVILVRNDTQLMRLTPLSTLIPSIQAVIDASALAQQYPVHLDVSGESLEIDQKILEALTPPLLAMLDTCTSDTSVIKEDQGQQKPCHVGFHAHKNGNDITIEISFSMPVLGGAFEILQKPLQKLNGSLTLRRNASGWISFYLSIPRSQGTVPCLLVLIGEQHYIISMGQIQRVSQQTQERPPYTYELRELLDQPPTTGSAKNKSKPLLIIQSPATRKKVGIVVDEVISEQELIIKPLPAFMQRPGITESAVDGQGNVLFLIDIPELIAHHVGGIVSSKESQEEDTTQPSQPPRSVPKILLADDSAYLRQRVLQALQREHYEVMEAKDGMEAVEQLLENTPDIFLLDIEMPNLNGYDVLTVIREYPELARVKTIMLTSRTSEKHKQRAQELGAQAYLPKPCPQEILLKTISELLAAK